MQRKYKVLTQRSPEILIKCFHIKDFLFSSTTFPILHVNNTHYGGYTKRFLFPHFIYYSTKYSPVLILTICPY